MRPWFACPSLCRSHHNLTQLQLANQLGISLGVLKKWEQNRVRISKESWRKLTQIR